MRNLTHHPLLLLMEEGLRAVCVECARVRPQRAAAERAGRLHRGDRWRVQRWPQRGWCHAAKERPRAAAAQEQRRGAGDRRRGGDPIREWRERLLQQQSSGRHTPLMRLIIRNATGAREGRGQRRRGGARQRGGSATRAARLRRQRRRRPLPHVPAG